MRDASSSPIPDLNQLLLWFWYNLVIGNNDCHSKNLAFVQTHGGLRLSPFYDLLSTAIYKEISPKFSYNIGGQFLWYKLHNRHLTSLAKEIGMREAALKNPADKLFKEIEKQLPKNILEFETRFNDIKTARIISKFSRLLISP